MDIDKVADEQDTSRLWTALLDAKTENDFKLVRAIEQRMRELSTDRRFAHLSDDDLRQRIDAISQEREPKGMLGHSPYGGGLSSGGGIDARHTSQFNEAHRRDQHANIEATRSALLDEWERRQASGA